MKLEKITLRFEETIKTKSYQNIKPAIEGTFTIDPDQLEAAQVKEAVVTLLQYFEQVKEEALEAAGGRKVIEKFKRQHIERWEFDED